MVKKTTFTGTEQRVIRAMYRLNRWATANEISIYADRMSWNTASKILKKLYRKKAIKTKIMNGKRHWFIRGFK